MISKQLLWTKALLRSLLISTFLISACLFLNTESGLDALVFVGKQFLPGQLTINTIHGRLLGPIHLKKLYYQNNKFNLYVSEAELDWHWSDLLRGKLNLDSIFIDQLNIFFKKNISQEKSNSYHKKTFQLPKIFHYLKLNSADIHKIHIRTDTLDLLLEGSIHKQLQINCQLNIYELNKFIPDLQGKITLKAKINGEPQCPKFNVILKKTNLAWKDFKSKETQGALNIDAKNKKWFFDLNTTQINNKIFKFTPLQLKLSGSLSPFSLQGSLYEFKAAKLVNAAQFGNVFISTTKIHSFISKYGLETSIQTLQRNKNKLLINLLLPHYQAHLLPTPKQPLRATINLSFKNLNFLTQLVPELKNVKGIFNSQMDVTGTLNKPLFNNLTLNLQQASLDIPLVGLKLKNINYQLHTDKNTLVGVGQVRSGNGYLALHTVTDLLKKNLSTLINLQGKDITILHSQEYQTTATLHLNIQANIHQIETHGYILFPKANIKINPKNYNKLELSNDVVFVSDKKKALTLPFIFKTDIKLEVGDDIQLQYQGLNTKLKGSLTIKQDSDHPVLATGELKLFPGEYSYYGQSLKLKPNSSLNFINTPINNPIINITASRNILILPTSSPDPSTDMASKLGSSNFIQSALFSSQLMPIQLEIDLHVKGTLQNPHIILSANPANIIKSQLDMLSYLITGQASNQLSSAGTQLLLNATTNLGSEKNNISQIISNLQRKMGLDQLTIGSKPIFNPTTNSLQQNTSLIVGKTISPKLTISYSLGLLDQISILEINYLLNKNFSLQTTSSSFANALDLLYKVEKH